MVDKSVVIELRKLTGAGIVECQKTLEETNGNIEEAIEILRKKGALKAAKKADRATNEGLVATAINEEKTKGVLIQVHCETDFVSRNEDFVNMVQGLADEYLAGKPASENFAEQKDELVMKIGENLQFANEGTLEGAFVVAYIHSNGKTGSLIAFDQVIDEDLANGIAMHAVAMSPDCLNPEDVNPETLEKEKEVYTEQLKNEGKPEEIIEKIMEGKVNKYYEDVCLAKQKYIKDDKKSIEEVLNGTKITGFLLFKI